MASLADGFHAVVVGATGGIGAAFARHLSRTPRCKALSLWSRTQPDTLPTRADWTRIDLLDEATIKAAADALAGPVDLVICATGALHRDDDLQPEKTWRHLSAEQLMLSFRLNTIGPALIATHVIDTFPRDRRAVFAALSARVGSISDNRMGGWHSYRSAKAALHQMIRCFAIEAARKRPEMICLALHPGTVDTDLSAPFQGNVGESKLFTPDFAAVRLLHVIDQRSPADSGWCFDWRGDRVPP